MNDKKNVVQSSFNIFEKYILCEIILSLLLIDLLKQTAFL